MIMTSESFVENAAKEADDPAVNISSLSIIAADAGLL
jgi:hypothetical protein